MPRAFCFLRIMKWVRPVLGRLGSELLFRAFRLSTVGAEDFDGRVRDGIGYGLLAMTTRSAKDGILRDRVPPDFAAARSGIPWLRLCQRDLPWPAPCPTEFLCLSKPGTAGRAWSTRCATRAPCRQRKSRLRPCTPMLSRLMLLRFFCERNTKTSMRRPAASCSAEFTSSAAGDLPRLIALSSGFSAARRIGWRHCSATPSPRNLADSGRTVRWRRAAAAGPHRRCRRRPFCPRSGTARSRLPGLRRPHRSRRLGSLSAALRRRQAGSRRRPM